jgi:hypothetical protein
LAFKPKSYVIAGSEPLQYYSFIWDKTDAIREANRVSDLVRGLSYYLSKVLETGFKIPSFAQDGQFDKEIDDNAANDWKNEFCNVIVIHYYLYRFIHVVGFTVVRLLRRTLTSWGQAPRTMGRTIMNLGLHHVPVISFFSTPQHLLPATLSIANSVFRP